MRLRKLFTILALPAIVGVTLTACSDIAEQDRFIELPAVEAQRVVLLEEFTGQWCVNCPGAHKTIASLVAQYPDNLVAVSIHAGNDLVSIGEGDFDDLTGFRLPEGATYAASIGAVSFPCGVVNRISGIQTEKQWAASVRDELQRPANLDLAVEAKLSDDGKQIAVTTTADPYANISGMLKVWVVESGMIALQLLEDNSVDMEYVHNHVYRGCAGSFEGEPVNLVIREQSNFESAIDVKPFWNPANIEVIAFIADQSGVLQAAKTHLAL